jgi:uncharacterized delta-60 repeat protein
MRKTGFRMVLLIIVLLLSSGDGLAQAAGALDPNFGAGGIVTYNAPNGGYFGDIAVQSDGKIVLGAASGPNRNFTLVRFNSNGTLDTNFGSGGTVTTPIFNNDFGSELSELAIQPDGKIIAVGYSSRYQFTTTKPPIIYYFEYAILRYNSNGTLDNTFSGDGITTTLLNNITANRGSQVALQPDGRIVVAATNQSDSPLLIVFRYKADGTLDTSFDGDGAVTTTFSDLKLRPSDVKIQADGKIMVSSTSGGGFQERSIFALTRFNSDGSLDTSFDGDGLVVTTIDGNDLAQSLLVQPNGKITAAGAATPGYQVPGNFGLARYNPNGALDATFDGDGKVSANFGAPTSGEEAVLQRDGKIVVVGTRQGSSAAVARFFPNGAVDTSFSGDGIATEGGSSLAVELQPDGKIVTGGASGGGAPMSISRYYAGAPTFVDFDGDGKTDVSIFRPSNGQWWLSRSSAGIYATPFGGSGDKIVPADFTGDGKTDIAFWRASSGDWYVLRSEDGSFFAHPFGTAGDIPAPADFDGDGRADEAVFRPSTATWYVLRSSGGIVIQQFGQNGDAPMPADYDGDGKADIGVWRASLGQWWIQRSSNNQTFAAQFGAPTDKAVAGDFTGDGKADVAFYRSSTGEWFVLRSEDNSFFSFPFGTNGDMPAPGDYDGDGKFDAAVFRSSSATWYLRGSTSGVIIQNFGASGDLPVPGAFVP